MTGCASPGTPRLRSAWPLMPSPPATSCRAVPAIRTEPAVRSENSRSLSRTDGAVRGSTTELLVQEADDVAHGLLGRPGQRVARAHAGNRQVAVVGAGEHVPGRIDALGPQRVEQDQRLAR